MVRAGRLGTWAKLKRELRFLAGLRRTLGRVKSVKPDSPDLVCDDIEAAVDRFAQRPAICFEGRTVTYAQLDAMANRYAHWATGRGIKRGDTVALFMPNRTGIHPGLVWAFQGRGGYRAHQQQPDGRRRSAHCLKISGAAHLICRQRNRRRCSRAVRNELSAAP